MALTLRQQKGSKLTIPEMDGNLTYLEEVASLENLSYATRFSSTDLTKIPNDYKGWKLLKNGTRTIYQSVEIGFTEKQSSITEIGQGYIKLPFLDKDDTPRYFTIGDIITISNATNINNNGDWKLSDIGNDGSLIVQQTIEKYLTPETIDKDGPFPTLTWKERVLLEFNWVHAQLEDGTLIWEAYDYLSEENNNGYGYWVAMRPNSTSGEYEYVSHLKMSDNFWDYWYNYTVKVDGEPNSVILTTLSQGTGSSNNIGSYNFKLSLINNELVLVETVYDLEKTWGNLFFELTGTLANSPQFAQPWYNSDNDWYGMMQGEEMGWYWMYENQYVVGYNMLNGQTQLIDISESLLNIKNIFYYIDPGFTLENALTSVKQVYSHSTYGLLLALDADTVSRAELSALWSPNYTNVEYATILDIYDSNGSVIYTEGGIVGNFTTYSLTANYFIVAEYYNTNDQAITFHRKQLDAIDGVAEVFSLPEFFDGNTYFTNGHGLYSWERENSFIVSVYHSGRAANDNFFVWRNDEAMPKLIKTPSLYPNMIEDNKLTNWDRAWNYNNITTMTINFKKDVL